MYHALIFKLKRVLQLRCLFISQQDFQKVEMQLLYLLMGAMLFLEMLKILDHLFLNMHIIINAFVSMLILEMLLYQTHLEAKMIWRKLFDMSMIMRKNIVLKKPKLWLKAKVVDAGLHKVLLES